MGGVGGAELGKLAIYETVYVCLVVPSIAVTSTVASPGIAVACVIVTVAPPVACVAVAVVI